MKQRTPTLEGEDKGLFLQDIANAKYSSKKQKFLEECDETHRQLKTKGGYEG